MIVIQPLKCNHHLWDLGVLNYLEINCIVTRWDFSSRIAIVLIAPMKLFFMLLLNPRSDVLLLSTLNLWLPLLRILRFRRKILIGVHNNLERRYSYFLNCSLLYITSSYYAFKRLGKNCTFLPHPRVIRGDLVKVRKLVFGISVSNEQTQLLQRVSKSLGLELVIKGFGGNDYVDDWDMILQETSILYIGKDYSRRCSSIIAQLMTSVDYVLISDIDSATNLFVSHGFEQLAINNDFGLVVYKLW